MIDAIRRFFGLDLPEGPCRVDPAGFSTKELLEESEYSGSWMSARDANRQVLKNIIALEDRVSALEGEEVELEYLRRAKEIAEDVLYDLQYALEWGHEAAQPSLDDSIKLLKEVLSEIGDQE